MTKKLATEGKAVVEQIKVVVSLTAFVSLLSGWWLSTRYWPLSILAITFVLFPTARRLLRLLNNVQFAMDDLREGFRDVRYANVRWGCDPSEPGVVKGPYCPNPAHGRVLHPNGESRDVLDSDVISETSPLRCPQDEAERFVLSDLGSGISVSVGSVRKQVAERLESLGVWKGA